MSDIMFCLEQLRTRKLDEIAGKTAAPQEDISTFKNGTNGSPEEDLPSLLVGDLGSAEPL